MLHSIYDLTTFCRKTAGDVPARLVGASTTVVGSKMYLFGGRLVTERRMVSDLYVFDLATFNWEKIPDFPEDDVPRPRYFHSADTWNNQLIIFGGMSNKSDSPNPDELCVLNDVRFFDLSTRHWLPSSLLPIPVSDSLVPRARYAHLSSVTADRLFIIGGQDFYNTWLDDVCVYDLLGKTWVQRREYPRHCGTYRSVAVSSNMTVRLPGEELRASQTPSTLGPPGTRFSSGKIPPNSPECTSPESLVHSPYTAHPTEDHPSDIFLYSNYNFTDVKRELEVFSPLPDTDFTIEDRSSAMTGNTFPPGLRFPTGAILGTHLIIAGTYLAHSYQSFSIWVLDLVAMTWSRIDPGKAVEAGSWFRGCLWAEANKFLVFGNRNGNLVDDYNRRLLSWDHVAVVDLDAFGIYQPPPLLLDIPMQELGLAALEERVLADFAIVCDDGRKISCSRKTLEERWPWFQEQRMRFLRNAKTALETLPTSTMHVPLPELPGIVEKSRHDPRLTPRYLYLSEPYPITLALLQYFYSLALLTPLQQAPAVLSQLLVLSATYQIPHLESLVKHAMHRALSNSTSVGVYEVATLCSARSLQIRALKTVMSYTQKRPSRSRQGRENGSGGRPSDGGGGGRPSTSDGGPGESKHSSRPRGTSDAKWRNAADSSSGYPTNYNHRGNTEGRSDALLTPVNEVPTRPGDQVSPLPFFVPKRSNRHSNLSVLSMRTDRELSAVAELLPPMLLDTGDRFGQLEGADTMTDSDHDSLIERYLHHRDLDSVVEKLSSANEVSYPPLSPSSTAPSTSSESEFDPSSDDHLDCVYPPHSPKHTAKYTAFHLPRYRRPRRISTGASDSDVPSLTSSASYSSLTSINRSHQCPSPPITPVSPTGSHCAIIEEQLPGDHEISRQLHMGSSENLSAVTIVPRDTPEGKSRSIAKSYAEWSPSKTRSRSCSPCRSTVSNSSTITPLPRAQRSVTNHHEGSTISFSHFLSKSKKVGKVSKTRRRTAMEISANPHTDLSLNAKTVKAEEKRRKGVEARAQTEKFAHDLILATLWR